MTKRQSGCPACKEIEASGLSYQEHTCAEGSPIVAALHLAKCTDCKALRGDPCRAPSGRTRMPHPGRRSLGS